MTAPKTSLQKAIDELTDGAGKVSRRALQEFSDLDSASLHTIMEAWPRVSPARKRTLLDGLADLSDDDTLVAFDEFARALLSDPDPQVRTRAIRLLDETTDVKLIPIFIKMLTADEDIETRGEAATALGKYVELGELEEIPAQTLRKVEDALLDKASSEDSVQVRRNALESLGFSSRPEVVTLIASAARRENPDWQASALFAMGRSFDERWEEQVLMHLEDVNPVVRLAAIEAVGELRLASAGNALLKVLEDEDDDDLSSAAIWSLSQIGGEDARLYIENLLDLAEDDEDAEFLQEALDNLEFTDELSRFDLMSVDPGEDE